MPTTAKYETRTCRQVLSCTCNVRRYDDETSFLANKRWNRKLKCPICGCVRAVIIQSTGLSTSVDLKLMTAGVPTRPPLVFPCTSTSGGDRVGWGKEPSKGKSHAGKNPFGKYRLCAMKDLVHYLRYI